MFDIKYCAVSALELKVYEIFKSNFGEKEAELVIEYFEAKSDAKYEQRKDTLLTKEDKIELISKIETSKTDMIKWFFAFFITLILMIAGLYLKK